MHIYADINDIYVSQENNNMFLIKLQNVSQETGNLV